jgi:hypothetical protein
VVGVELSDVRETTCGPLFKQGLVKQGPLHKIPYPDGGVDVVFSSEVLEHVPPHLAQASVDELVRCAKRTVFATISLRPSALDKPGTNNNKLARNNKHCRNNNNDKHSRNKHA